MRFSFFIIAAAGMVCGIIAVLVVPQYVRNETATPLLSDVPQTDAREVSGLLVPAADESPLRQELLGILAKKLTLSQKITYVAPHADEEEHHHEEEPFVIDIRTAFPDAVMSELPLNEEATWTELQQGAQALRIDCPDCLLIVANDLSLHDSPEVASLQNERALRGLRTMAGEILRSETEMSDPGLVAFLTAWAEVQNTQRYTTPTATPYGWYETGEPAPAASGATFLLGGDMMFGRMVAHTYLKSGLEKVFEKIGQRTFTGIDAALANLEGPVSTTPVPDDIRENNLVFNFPPETISALQYLGLNGVSLANNHSANAGKKGLDTTYAMLDGAKIAAIGGPSDTYVARTASFTGQNLTLHVIGVHLLATTPDLTAQIQNLKKDPTNRVLIFPHWGAEYKAVHGKSQEVQAYSWIDAGADLVIGAHPHVIQDAEVYKGKPIFYSMGNFVFDQTFSKETQEGLLIGGSFSDEGLRVFALPVGVEKYKPYLMEGDRSEVILENLYASLTEFRHGTELFFPL